VPCRQSVGSRPFNGLNMLKSTIPSVVAVSMGAGRAVLVLVAAGCRHLLVCW
jgi:hypothetical protein